MLNIDLLVGTLIPGGTAINMWRCFRDNSGTLCVRSRFKKMLLHDFFKIIMSIKTFVGPHCSVDHQFALKNLKRLERFLQHLLSRVQSYIFHHWITHSTKLAKSCTKSNVFISLVDILGSSDPKITLHSQRSLSCEFSLKCARLVFFFVISWIQSVTSTANKCDYSKH